MSETKNNEEPPAEDKNQNFEDDGEDIPDTFFDDFQDQDFMDGLNVVDDWQDEDEGENSEELKKEEANSQEQIIQDPCPQESNNQDQVAQESKIEELGAQELKTQGPGTQESGLIGPGPQESGPQELGPQESLIQESGPQGPRLQESVNQKSGPKGAGQEKPREERLDRRDGPRGGYPRERRRSYSRGRRSRSRHRYDYPPTGRRRDDSRPHDPSRRSRSPRRADVSGRRDPEKTKRDIQRDKLRCAKDHEARVFQEQLKIAETGLCPPGTELDVVLNSERFKKEEVLKKVLIPMEKRPHPEPKVPVMRLEKIEKKEEIYPLMNVKISRSPVKIIRRSPHSSSLRRRKSNHRTISRDRSFSPKRRRRSSLSRERERERDRLREREIREREREREWEREREREREKERERRYRERHEIPETDLRYRIREKREVRQLMEGSPIRSKSPHLYNKSPGSEISEREAWLRNREQYRKRHSRSLSPVNTSRIRDSSPKEKKFTFLEEIEIKLRQTQPKRDQVTNQFNMIPPLMPPMGVPNPQFMQPQQVPFQPPTPVPAPGMFPIPDQYQQTLMIPDPNLMPPLMFPPPTPMFPHGMAPYPVPQPVPAPNMYQHNQTQQLSIATQGANQENTEIAKLFEDKKISLSDFLSVSAKPLDAIAPLDIHNKIKVLSRCQEALKIIEDPKFIGRFIPRVSYKLMEAEKRAAEKTKGNNQSPLRKGVTVKFNFTVPSNRRTHNKYIDQQSPKISVHKLLSILGMPDNADLTSPIPEEIAGQLEERKKEEAVVGAPVVKEVVKKHVETFSASTQASIPCSKCVKRNAINYKAAGTQTTKEVCEIGTQVSVEDLTKSCTTFIPRGILKSTTSPVKSISHLTPAQLLAQMESDKPEGTSPQKQENYPPARRPLLEHRIDKPPEAAHFDRGPPGNFGPDHNRFGGHNMGGHNAIGRGNVVNYGHGLPMGDRDNNQMGGNRGLLNTPYRPHGPGPNNNGPGPNPNRPNYPMNQDSYGRPYHGNPPNPNLSNWNNQGMGMGMRPPNHNMYYNNQRGPN